MTAELLAAYLATGYRLTLPGPDGATLALRVGRRHPGLDRWLVRHHPGVNDWTWLTAVNPRSRPLGRAANLQRLTDLVAALAAAGFDCCPGLARDPTGRWPDEASGATVKVCAGPVCFVLREGNGFRADFRVRLPADATTRA